MTELSEYPYVRIPCESIKSLKILIDALYDTGVLTDESIQIGNCPDNIIEILDKDGYFDMVEVGGIRIIKGQVEKKTEDLL